MAVLYPAKIVALLPAASGGADRSDPRRGVAWLELIQPGAGVPRIMTIR